MSEKHYPYIGGGFDRIIFDGDESVWVPEAENARLLSQLAEWKRVAESKQDIIDHMRDANAENRKLRELVDYMTPIAWHAASEHERNHMHELGIEVDK